MTTRQYKSHKGLKKESLRDNMSTTELVLNMLAETATKEISQSSEPTGFDKNKSVARRGGNIAGNARKSKITHKGDSIANQEEYRGGSHQQGEI